MQINSSCGLCGGVKITHYHQDKLRHYWQCECCQLVFVDESERLTPQQEKVIYDSHQNDLGDEGYRRFLSRVADPILARTSPPAIGLDFGCGPGPLLAHMLTEAGHKMSVYDLYYANDPEVLTGQYDFISCTEVIEHIAQPKSILSQLFSLLKPGAPLVLMTKLVIDKTRFATWHYKNDLTHISFFSRKTFAYVAQIYGSDIEFVGNDVIILTKPEVLVAPSEEIL
ncbi:methyltransferase [Pseudoalteromonas amylolytica]|uniref:Methyltransferase n=1 Tax=Pseudoalteromonas amylolytica TaxID=1859457 RepID=A0A1S1MTI6_9GAMM|nr:MULTISPECIES: class I SAM-dependent methyltransferase [Pseudoalteromonas]OHU86076.1 methyltransferase [Pseudoalteromonas sp. JW3]OHU89816.1 methyltransferase [Pseudoalteromonas amylolytica]